MEFQVPIRSEDITNTYKLRADDVDTNQERSARLNITVASYSAKGELSGLHDVNGAMFQMCNGSFKEFDAAFNIGIRYFKSCQIPAHVIFDRKSEPVFYDLYIPYKKDRKSSGPADRLYAIPIAILNKNQNQVSPILKSVPSSALSFHGFSLQCIFYISLQSTPLWVHLKFSKTDIFCKFENIY